MTWHWFLCLLGAPIWGSIAVALFAGLLAASNRSQRAQSTLDPDVTSLSEYRLRRNLRLAVLESGAAREGQLRRTDWPGWIRTTIAGSKDRTRLPSTSP